jgi:hypothetical protein
LTGNATYSLSFSTATLVTIDKTITSVTNNAELAIISTKNGNLKFCKNNFITTGFSREVRYMEPNQLPIDANSFKNPLMRPTTEVSSRINTKNVSKPDPDPIAIGYSGDKTIIP